MLLNWLPPGVVSVSQSHWMTPASNRAVGVSALYSSSFGASVPLNARSNRPYTNGSSASHESMTSCSNSLGMRNRPNIRSSITFWTSARHISCRA